MSKLANLATGLLLSISLALAGCEEVECDPCEGEDCNSFQGEFYGTLESLNETCADVVLVTGDNFMNVMSVNPLTFEYRDSRGLWAVFNGNLCATNDEDYPMTYFFTSDYSPDTTGKDYVLDYTLVGFFSVEDQSAEVITATATLDLRFVFDDGEICTLSGDVRLAKTF